MFCEISIILADGRVVVPVGRVVLWCLIFIHFTIFKLIIQSSWVVIHPDLLAC